MKDVDILCHDAADHAFFFEFCQNRVDDVGFVTVEAVAEFLSPCIKYGGIFSEEGDGQDIFDGVSLPGFGIDAVFPAEILDSG